MEISNRLTDWSVKADFERGVIDNGYVRKAQPYPRKLPPAKKSISAL
jgi:hypothetical protein